MSSGAPESVSEFLSLLQQLDAGAIAWDWDQTAMSFHSGGALSGTAAEQDNLLRMAISPDFAAVCAALMRDDSPWGIRQAVVTFSDEKHAEIAAARAADLARRGDARSGGGGGGRGATIDAGAKPIAGEKMVRRGLEVNFGALKPDGVAVYAMHPVLYQYERAWEKLGLDDPPPMYKRWHLSKVSEQFGLPPKRVCLIDDDLRNCDDAASRGCLAVHVRTEAGFAIRDAIPQLREALRRRQNAKP